MVRKVQGGGRGKSYNQLGVTYRDIASLVVMSLVRPHTNLRADNYPT